jgi:DNA-binding Xre family transcriptional regulator
MLYIAVMTVRTDRVRRFLDENEKGAEWLAVQLGCCFKTVHRILSGKVVGLKTMLRLAKLMGCQVEDLVTREVAKRPA